MIIDAKDLILGRFATVAAKRAILGEDVVILNSELAVITGNRETILEKYLGKSSRGGPFHGPIFQKSPHLFVKRVIRGMLTYKKEKGRSALKRVKCYKGIPEEFKDREMIKIEKANISKIQNLKYMTVDEICSLLKQR